MNILQEDSVVNGQLHPLSLQIEKDKSVGQLSAMEKERIKRMPCIRQRRQKVQGWLGQKGGRRGRKAVDELRSWFMVEFKDV